MRSGSTSIPRELPSESPFKTTIAHGFLTLSLLQLAASAMR